MQSGKPVGVFRTHAYAPRVLIANSNLVGRWATWDYFRELERAGLIMYGQMTAGSWIYIGSQGILQGTYETFGAVARTHFGGSLAGRFVLTAGLGGMGGAQPLAATMNGAAILGIEVDEARIDKRLATGYCDRKTRSLDEALAWIREATRVEAARCRSASSATRRRCCRSSCARGVTPDVLTDQTSAHDTLNGYVPAGLTLDAGRRRSARAIPAAYVAPRRRVDRRARARDARACSSAARSRSTTATTSARSRSTTACGTRSTFRASCRSTSARCSARARGRSAGSRCRAIPNDLARTDELVLELFPARRAPAPVDHAGARARALPGTAGAHLLAGAGRARAVRRRAQRSRGERRDLARRS